MVRGLAEIVQPHSVITRCRDETDNRVLECALDSRADWIVTGDSDLLDLKDFQGLKIVSVAEFLVAVNL